ncbi:hypothetical protein MNB_SV-13-2016 [hydrothermal vent metagenome]|uniref:Uncharacterized protein n=1 Tax=hydrothermal vent metagenome TaxID=652676 RepID=A0A1W1D194_9ZZZZ
MEILEEYHDELSTVLVNVSNSIDDYFIEDNSSSLKSKTYAKFSSSIAMEGNQKIEKDMRLRLRLNLPKIQKNLRIIFEDDNYDNSFYDRTTLNSEKLKDKSYYLRLEYLKLVKKKFNLGLGLGLRVRQGNLVPYLNFRSRYDVFKNETFKSLFRNRFRYYSDGEKEDVLEFSNIYIFDNSVYTILQNELSYSNRESYEFAYHDLSLIKKLSDRKQLSIGMGIRSDLVNFKDYNIEYYHIHSLYHCTFYKSWLYYEVSPSVLWRESNNFNISYRLMLNFGILFKK